MLVPINRKEGVMDRQFKRACFLILLFSSLLLFLPSSVQAQQFITLSAILRPGQAFTTLAQIAPTPQAQFVVPTGKVLVLTDFVIAPQTPPSTTTIYRYQINPQPASVFTTQMAVQASSAEPSSFQVHMTTGMVFKAGALVTVSLTQGTVVNFYAYGYLGSAS
jgi:hypothetical protein